MKIKRWAALTTEGDIVGIGINLKRSDPIRFTFVGGGLSDWRDDKQLIARLHDGNFAHMLRQYPKRDKIQNYKHGRIRTYRRSKHKT